MAEVLTYDPSNDPQAIQAAEERDAESLAVGEQMEADQEQMLAGKYRNAEELEAAYLELQKKMGESSSDEVEQDNEVDEYQSEDPVSEMIDLASDEYAETGELSPETMEAFKELSSEELVDAYVRMQANAPSESVGREMTDAEVTSVYDSVGGAEEYQQLTSWASENLSEAEIEAYDGLVNSGNAAAINLALQAINAKYVDAMGSDGETLQGKPARSRDVFRSQAEVVRAMSDPRYDNDPAYRADIMDKLSASDLEF